MEATTTMCDLHMSGTPGEAAPPPDAGQAVSRRRILGAAGASAAAVTAGGVLFAGAPAARAVQTASAGPALGPLSVTLLGTAGGPEPLAARFGISSALTLNGTTYVIDCGRGSVSQYLRTGLSLASLDGIFLTHLHSDHTVDYYSYPLLAATTPAAFAPVTVYGPGPAGEQSLAASAPGPVPGTAGLTALAGQSFAASSTFFMAEHIGVDPGSLVSVREVMPPSGSGASLSVPAPVMSPFTVAETSDMTVSAICVSHGAAYPAYAYRFDTDHGSVVFSGDTAPTPNIVTLAKGADLLVHEVVDLAAFAGLGLPQALITHLADVHTDVTLLGEIAAEAGVGELVTTHLGPPDPSVVSDAQWRTLLRDSASKAGYRGRMIPGRDLMSLPVGRSRP